ncbi:host specificity factor TipJ family phage tail protein [Halocella sp. SP3-1]|uniref:host specificity protein J n=1 Tax=Halocella sp. SP3-1 TaxID=2382161 RepID=UPI0013DF53EC|nr:host specificity factor TipJ family phage tail protein [Halocella sp. SP3-1]
MINLVIVKNPFKTDKEIKQVSYVPEQPVFSYIQPHFMGVEVVISHNGKIVSENEYKTLVPSPGDYIAVCPVIEGGGGDGKDIGRTLAVIGLSIITLGVGSVAAGGAFFGGVGASGWGIGSWLAAAGVQIAGGYLINKMFPTGQTGSDYEMEQTYAWSEQSPTDTEGKAIPITFGTVRMGVMAPIQMLSRHVTANGKKQYMSMLLCGGEGPVDSISDLTINDNPHTNYDGVTYETRYGTNAQPVISNFNDTYFTQSVSYELKKGASPSVNQLDGEYEGIEITLNFPSGLYDSDDGDIDDNWVDVVLRYRLVGSSTWNYWGKKRISGEYTYAFKRSCTINNLPKGQYEVSVQCTGIDHEGTGDANTVYWTALTGIIYDDFVYPNKVLVGLKALATDQLSGSMPTIHWTQTRNNVWVWNPNTNQYEQKAANNPAWACYDLIHRCRRLKNINTGQYEHVVSGIPAARIDYQAFVDWAEFCNDRKLYYNGVIYETSTLWDSLEEPERTGRGRVLMRGTKFSCVCDALGEPVQLFNISNMKLDTFQEEFLGTEDRANALEITFFNTDNNYEDTTIPVYGPGYDESTSIENPTQVTLDSAMTLDQAYRYGAYQLRVNYYINRTVSWTADIDAIACQAGDVILLQHDVPRWGEGGRIVSATVGTVTLDKKVDLSPDTDYSIMIRLQDDTLIERSIRGVTEETTTDTLTVAEPFISIPQEYDIYSFGEVEKVAKPFRLTSISREGDFRCKLQATEYIEEVYGEAENIPIIDYTTDSLFFEVEELSTKEQTFMKNDGTTTSQLWCSWSIPRGKSADEYYIYYSNDGENWNYIGSTIENSFNIDEVRVGKIYYVKICVKVGVYISPGQISDSVYITGKDSLPTAPASLTVSQQGTGVIFRWSQVDEPDIIGYEIRRGADWSSGEMMGTKLTGDRWTSNNEVDGTYRYMIKSIDRIGQYSNSYVSTIFEVSGTRNELNVLEERDELANIDNATLDNLDKINDRITFHHMFTLDDLEGYSLDDWPNLDAFADGLLDYNGYAEYISESIDTGHIGKTGIRINKDWYFEDLGLSLLSFPDKSLDDFPNYSLDNPPAIYETEIYMRFSDDNAEWTDWQSYLTGEYTFRYVQFKITFQVETETADFDFNEFVEIFDVPDIELEIENITVPVGGATLTYSDYDTYFYNTPKGYNHFIMQDGSTMKYAKFTNRTNESVDIQVLDINNTDVGGTIEQLTIEGY